MDQNSAVLL
uniref:Uncharacterized protein n=1 Tax=Anguilla anguilla TaxID=7936 RepID=A0A0E9UX14_ANGAN